MKVSLPTVEISDEDRTRLADVLDGKISKRKATRNEAKDFIWECGEDWPTYLSDQWNEKFGEADGDGLDDLI